MNTQDNLLTEWVEAGFLGPAEEAAISVIQRRLGIADDVALLAVGLAVCGQQLGHSCVDLTLLNDFLAEVIAERDITAPLPPLPSSEQFEDRLRQSSLLVREIQPDDPGSTADAAADRRPLVMLPPFVYTQRQFFDELSIAEQVAHRAGRETRALVDSSFIDRVLPPPDLTTLESDDQADSGAANGAATSVVTKELTILTGGPGTGKTYTLTRCLAALLSEREAELASLDIAVAAPTGKAAARAKDLIAVFVAEQRSPGASSLGLPDSVLGALAAVEPRTIHSLLGHRRGTRTRFAHDAHNPLTHDVIIVDEMSMVPAFLMARLFEAIRPGATVLLVGDQAQLESVESGSVLRSIVDASQQIQTESGVYELTRVYRQDKGTEIGDLARLIRSGDSGEVADIVNGAFSGVSFIEQSAQTPVVPGTLSEVTSAMRTVKQLALSTEQSDHRIAYGIALEHKVLCGPRSGPTGVLALNDIISQEVHGSISGGLAQPGTPLLVTVNSPRARLVNGDVGLVVYVTETDGNRGLRVFFPDGEAGRYLTMAELPPTEVSYAMTIHKSQGSEYPHLTVFLPSEESPLLTRELVYTAVTRARSSLLIVGSLKALTKAINHPSRRMTGLSSMILSKSATRL